MSSGADLRLRHPALDFWVDVRVRHLGSSWVAVADLAGTPEIAAADQADVALLLALWPLGGDIARDLAASARLDIELATGPRAKV